MSGRGWGAPRSRPAVRAGASLSWTSGNAGAAHVPREIRREYHVHSQTLSQVNPPARHCATSCAALAGEVRLSGAQGVDDPADRGNLAAISTPHWGRERGIVVIDPFLRPDPCADSVQRRSPRQAEVAFCNRRAAILFSRRTCSNPRSTNDWRTRALNCVCATSAAAIAVGLPSENWPEVIDQRIRVASGTTRYSV